MNEINPSKSTGDNRVHGAANTWEAYLGISATVREDIRLSHFDESQLTIIAVSEIVLKPDVLAYRRWPRARQGCVIRIFYDTFETMESGPHQAE